MKTMKEEFLIFEVEYEDWSVVETSHIDTVETELEAIQRISELIQVTKPEHFPEFGFTFKRVFTEK
jgi:hypothetical protein